MTSEKLEFERLLADITRRVRGPRWSPNTDVFVDEERSEVIVKVELAEADLDRLHVGVDERYLFIVGRRTDGTRFARGSFLQKEIEYGDFLKKIHLPLAVERENVSATYGSGMLTIRLPIATHEAVPTSRTE
ncbi:MAG: Hsp20/alpha crystallin family protein, partial [Candidatus Eremiobacteraeota bacterium]|nr:Hsp20/alpha crystallin family protein [Candidatus Eremiobacteraeota bacterium]